MFVTCYDFDVPPSTSESIFKRLQVDSGLHFSGRFATGELPGPTNWETKIHSESTRGRKETKK